MKPVVVRFLTVALAACASCGGTLSVEDVSTSSQVLVSECSAAVPDARVSHRIDEVSADSYDNPACYKARVYDIEKYDGNAKTAAESFYTRVSWADDVPSLSACTSATLRTELSRKLPGALDWEVVATKARSGVVRNRVCVVPSVVFDSTLMPVQSGYDYRVTASARRNPFSQSCTRKVAVQTMSETEPAQ